MVWHPFGSPPVNVNEIAHDPVTKIKFSLVIYLLTLVRISAARPLDCFLNVMVDKLADAADLSI